MRFYFLLSSIGLTSALLATTASQTTAPSPTNNTALDQTTSQLSASPQAGPTEQANQATLEYCEQEFKTCIKSAGTQAWKGLVKTEKAAEKGLKTAGSAALDAGAIVVESGINAGKVVYQAAKTTVTSAGQEAIKYGQKTKNTAANYVGNSIGQLNASIGKTPGFLQNIKAILTQEFQNISSIGQALEVIQRISCRPSEANLFKQNVTSLRTNAGEICVNPILGLLALELCKGYKGFETNSCYSNAIASKGKPPTTFDLQTIDIIFQALENKFGAEAIKQFFASLDTETQITPEVKKLAESLKPFYVWRNEQNNNSQKLQNQLSSQVTATTNNPITTNQIPQLVN